MPTFKRLPGVLVVPEGKLVGSEGVSAYQRPNLPVEGRNFQEYVLVLCRTRNAQQFQQLVPTHQSPKLKVPVSVIFPPQTSLPLSSLQGSPSTGLTCTREHVPAFASLQTTSLEHLKGHMKDVYSLRKNVQTRKINEGVGLCWLTGWGLRKHSHGWKNNLAKYLLCCTLLCSGKRNVLQHEDDPLLLNHSRPQKLQLLAGRMTVKQIKEFSTRNVETSKIFQTLPQHFGLLLVVFCRSKLVSSLLCSLGKACDVVSHPTVRYTWSSPVSDLFTNY